ncbi:alpha/beta fold hydrolase [Streptomyces sp. NPDC007851]|uniref:thioesterase II family protein n=1 Tax=Streptomyces sp. NPDC007851 TaxID=3155008 RepID=UPI0034023469
MSRNLVRLTAPGKTAVFLLPFAGASASSYWSWAELLPAGFEVSAVQLPGRQDRWEEAPYEQFDQVVDDLTTEVAAVVDGRDFVLVGHSLGAAIGFEVAHELRARSLPAPALLVISSATAPQVDHEVSAEDRLSDDELIAKTKEGGRLPSVILDNPELLELVLPSLRADLRLVGTYKYVPREPLGCPMSIFGGRQDPLVPVSGLEPWRELTSNRASLRTYDGDHFYLWEHEQEVAAALLADMRQEVAG